MKQLIILSALFILFSCSRNNDDRQRSLSQYYGIYNSTNGDTTEITKGNGDYTVFRFAVRGLGTRFTFDSVLISDDKTFVDNEIAKQIVSTTPHIRDVTSVGSGTFGSNTVNYHFVCKGNIQVMFNGVKR